VAVHTRGLFDQVLSISPVGFDRRARELEADGAVGIGHFPFVERTVS
jgi:hypothetical protein